jgi:hypothetical protein
MVSTLMRAASPKRMMEPLPKLRSIWFSTKLRAFSFSGLFVIWVAINASRTVLGIAVDHLFYFNALLG